MKKIILSAVIFILALRLSAQEGRKVGISASVQSDQYGISVPVWVNNNVVIAPALDMKYAEKVGTDLGIALAARYYLSRKVVSPYIGLKFGALINMPESSLLGEPENTVDILVGLAFGGEYFLSDHFSLGIELQGNFTKSDEFSARFGNPDGLNFNTASAVIATLYF